MAFPQGAHGRGGSQPGQCFEQFTDLRAGHPVITVAAMAFHVEQPGLDQFGQVRAGGRGGYPGLGRQRGGGQGAAVAESEEHLGPARVGQHAGHRGDVGVSGYLSHTAQPTSKTVRRQTKQMATTLGS